MRGGPLSHPDVVKVLEPFVVAAWNGRRPEDMPPDVAEAWRRADPEPHNISCIVLDPDGKFVRAFWPMPGFEPGRRPGPGGRDPFDADSMAKGVLAELEKAAAGLPKPAAPKATLSLPTAAGRGVRVLFSLKTEQRGPANYRAPVVEAAAFGERERKALARSAEAREVAASELAAWLGQIYPPAIMDSSGEPPAPKGTLKLEPLAGNKARLKGRVEFTMDDRARTTYSIELEGLLTYSGDEPATLRAAFEGRYPKAGPPGARALEYSIRGVLESTPD